MADRGVVNHAALNMLTCQSSALSLSLSTLCLSEGPTGAHQWQKGICNAVSDLMVLYGRLDRSLPHAGLQLGSDRWVSALVYADDVVLLSWTAAGPQDLLDSMHAFCLSLGLTISPSKTEVVVLNAAALTRGMLGSMFSLGLHPSSTWALSFMSLAA